MKGFVPKFNEYSIVKYLVNKILLSQIHHNTGNTLDFFYKQLVYKMIKQLQYW